MGYSTYRASITRDNTARELYRSMLRSKGIEHASSEIVSQPKIDLHVHDRDWAQAYKTTIRSVWELARSQGIVAYATMPNTQPSITTPLLVESRLVTAKSQSCLNGYYLYIGATENPDQLKAAFKLAEEHERVIGIKLYAGETTGDIKLIEEGQQRMVFRVAKEVGYKGLIVCHVEKHSFEKPKLWVPTRPSTWNEAKPPEAEFEGTKDILRYAREEGFEGHLHICHTSCPETVELVNELRPTLPFQVSCCATPQHLIFSTEDMQTPEGTILKVNPPIRDLQRMLRMRTLLKEGKLNWIETDHADHALLEKTFDPSAPEKQIWSGIPSIVGLSAVLQYLVDKEIVTMSLLQDLVYNNPKKAAPKITE